MNQGINDHRSTQNNDVRDIPKWTHRYAQSRTALPGLIVAILIPTVVIGIMASIMMPPLILMGHRMPPAVKCGWIVGVLVLAIWLLARHHARYREIVRGVERKIANWIYRAEGEVTIGSEGGYRWPPHWTTYLGVLLIYVPIQILFRWAPVAPRYYQPLTALLWVPWLTYFGLRPPAGSPPQSRLWLVWPALYTVHAVLIMLGVPVYPPGDHPMLATCGLFLGYAALAAVASHIYARYALRRLRTLATSPEEAGGGQR